MTSFSDTKELIKSLENYTGSLEDALSTANNAISQLNDDIAYAQYRLEVKERSDYPTNYAKSLARIMRESPGTFDTLKNSIQEAVKINEEFSIPAYLEPLLAVANERDIYNFRVVGSGWSSKLKASIIFEEVAGRLEDWANGILGYREELEVKPGRGARATRWWLKKVFRTSLEASTIEGRLQYAGRPAPYWQILNSGSPASMASDREDGSYNPIRSVPTDFIGTAESQLEVHFKDSMELEHSTWKLEIRSLRDVINTAHSLVDELIKLIDRLRADEKYDRAIITVLNSRSKSGDISEFVDKKKLREAVKRFRAGEDFTTQRIELTVRNAENKRIRPRATTLIRILEGLEGL